VFNALLEAGFSPTVVELARAGFGKGAEMLAPFVALLHPLKQSGGTMIEDDQLPPETMIGDLPSWSLDVFSREGRRSLEAFLQGDSATATWVRTHIPPSQRVRFLGGLLFRAEGGLLRSRLLWPTGDELRRLVDVECNGPHCLDATEILQLMKADITALNEVRLQLNGGLI